MIPYPVLVFVGLIIDAFGELRKKDDLVLEELKNKCFICGLSLADFKNPHEFDTHVNRHHSLKNYMYLLLLPCNVDVFIFIL